MSGIVYCLTNPSMPGYVKIGITEDSLETRLKGLDTTSVPLPFECIFAIEVENPKDAEKLLHDAFADNRVRSTREFFQIDEQRVVSAMRLTGGNDVTPSEDIVEDEESVKALETARKARDRINFQMVNIPPGTELHFRYEIEGSVPKATVLNNNRLLFEGREVSITASALDLLRRYGWKLPSNKVQGAVHWFYEGESLRDRRLRMEEEGDI